MIVCRSHDLDRRANILLVASCGTGKSNFAIAQRKTVRCCRVTELITTLLEAREDLQLLQLRGQLGKLDLLILDELGHVSASKSAAELLIDMSATACERNSVVVTTNLAFKNQGKFDELGIPVSLTRLKRNVPVIYVAPVEEFPQPIQADIVLRKTDPVAAMCEAAVVKVFKPLCRGLLEKILHSLAS